MKSGCSQSHSADLFLIKHPIMVGLRLLDFDKGFTVSPLPSACLQSM